MRILIVTTDFLPNVSGIATLSYEHARGLACLGHDVRVITISPGASNHTLGGAFEVTEYIVPFVPIFRLRKLLMLVMKELNKWKPDLVWCTNYRGFGLPVMLAARINRTPYGVYLHGTELITENRNLLRKRIFSQVVANAKVVCTNSRNTARLLTELFGLKGTPVTPGVHILPEEARSKTMTAAKLLREQWLSAKTTSVNCGERLVLLSACRISRQKGLHLVLQSLALLKTPLREKLLFVIVGSGDDLTFMQQLVDDLGITNNVLFPGPMEHHEIALAYAAADLYVQPSQPEGNFLESFGISFLEAQAYGLPCIGSDWGGVPEAVLRDKTAILVTPGSAKQIKEAIERVVVDAEWRRSASIEGKAWAAENTWTNHVAKLARLLAAAQHGTLKSKM